MTTTDIEEILIEDKLYHVLCVRYKEIPMSIYINLKEKDFIEISNLDTDVIKDTFINISSDSEVINIVNLYSLEIIKEYDKTKNSKLLELAEFINAKILDIVNEDYIILNRIQIAFRKGSLSKKDKDELYNIRDRNKKIKIQLAIAILLNNQNDCRRYISKLNDKELKEIQNYPIWSMLPKELIK